MCYIIELFNGKKIYEEMLEKVKTGYKDEIENAGGYTPTFILLANERIENLLSKNLKTELIADDEIKELIKNKILELILIKHESYIGTQNEHRNIGYITKEEFEKIKKAPFVYEGLYYNEGWDIISLPDLKENLLKRLKENKFKYYQSDNELSEEFCYERNLPYFFSKTINNNFVYEIKKICKIEKLSEVYSK